MESSMEFRGIPLIQCNSMEFSMEFYETEVDGIPWNSMKNSIEFRGIQLNSMKLRQLTEFDGIRFRQGHVT
jgi:hypothetical protein